MVENSEIGVPFPTDSKGMIGRECPICNRYFKILLGTGLSTKELICPYCEYKAENTEFTTNDQKEYFQSFVVNQILGQSIKGIEESKKDIERFTRNSPLQIIIESTGIDLPIQYYSEKVLETDVICDACGLHFAINGIFASCPDCSRLTSMSIFKISLESSRKRLDVISKLRPEENELREIILLDSLISCVSSFDGLGKRFVREYPLIFPDKPRNLFQNIDLLQELLEKNNILIIEKILSAEEYSKLRYYFQVRHISSHNFGEIDQDFVNKTQCDPKLIGTKPFITKEDIIELINLVEKLGIGIRNAF